jgi:hypothetical protein
VTRDEPLSDAVTGRHTYRSVIHSTPPATRGLSKQIRRQAPVPPPFLWLTNRQRSAAIFSDRGTPCFTVVRKKTLLTETI